MRDGRCVSVRRSVWAAAAAALFAAGAVAVPAAAQPEAVSVAGFDRGGLDVVVLASFDAAGSQTWWSAAGSRWGAAGTLVEGDAELAEGSDVVRVMVPKADGSLFRLNDGGPLVLREFFGAGGAGADLTVRVVTASGSAEFAAAGVRNAGSNFVNFGVPDAQRAVLAGIGAGDRFVLALTRLAPAADSPSGGGPGDDEDADEEDEDGAVGDGGGSVPAGVSVWETAGDLPESTATSGRLGLGEGARAAVGTDAYWDADWFGADLEAGTGYLISVLGAGTAGCTLPAGYVMAVRDAAGNAIEGTRWTDSSRSSPDAVVFTPERSGRFYVEAAGGGALGHGTYLVALTAAGDGAAGRTAAIGAGGCYAPAPGRVQATADAHDSVTVRWEPPVFDSVTGYRVLRGPDAGSLTALADVGLGAASFADGTVEPGASYVYAVAALSPIGQGARSAAAAVTVPDRPDPKANIATAGAKTPAGDGTLLRRVTRGALPPSPPDVLAANAGGLLTGRQLRANRAHDQWFVTGPAQVGWLLDGVSFHADIFERSLDSPEGEGLTLSLWADNAAGDGPGAKLRDIGYFESRRHFTPVASKHDSRSNLGVFLFPDTRYWLRYESPQTTLNRRANTSTDTLPGWTLDNSVAVELRGTHAHGDPETGQPEPLINSDSVSPANDTASPYTRAFAQRFTTGPNPGGYYLIPDFGYYKLRVAGAGQSHHFDVRLYSDDGAGEPAEIVAEFPPVAGRAGNMERSWTASPPIGTVLAPDTTYWMAYEPRAGNQISFLVASQGSFASLLELADGWSLDGGVHAYDGTTWTEQADRLVFNLKGVPIEPLESVEPGGGDFAGGHATAGVLRPGQTGVAWLSDHGDEDWFRLEGLRDNVRYRVDVDFLGGDEEMGGSAHMWQGDQPRSDLWAVNFNGHTVIDFTHKPPQLDFGEFREAKYVEIESVNPFPWSSSGVPRFHSARPIAALADSTTSEPTEFDELNGATAVATHTIANRHYAVIASFDDNGVQIVDITDPANPQPTASITDDADGFNTLNGARRVATHTIAGRHYALVAAGSENGLQIIDITDPANPTPTASITDGVDGFSNLRGAWEVATVTIGGRHYALVTAFSDSGVQIVDITDPADPQPTASITDGVDGFDELRRATGIAVHTAGSRHYALVTAFSDSGVQIVDITDPADPQPTASITDGVDGFDELEGAWDVAVHTTAAGRHYALVASDTDSGVQIIDITDPADPQPTASITVGVDGFDRLRNAYAVATVTIGHDSYALVAGRLDSAVQIIDITDPTNPMPAGALVDGEDGYSELDQPNDVAVHLVGGHYIGLVPSFNDDGVQLFELRTRLPTRDNWYVGPYTVTLTEIGGWAEFVHNRPDPWQDPDGFQRVGHLHNAGQTGHVREVAVDFTTGDNTDGYTLDRIEVNMTPEPIEYTPTITDYYLHETDLPEGQTIDIQDSDVVVAVRQLPFARPEVAVHADSSGDPGAELCRLEPVSGYDAGLWHPTSTPGLYVRSASSDPFDRFYSGECAAQTLAADTKYWLVFKSHRRFPDLAYGVVRAVDRNRSVDVGGDGWAIGSTIKRRTYTLQDSTDWLSLDTSIALAISGWKN